MNFKVLVVAFCICINLKSDYLDYLYKDLSVSHNAFGQGGLIHLPSAETKKEASISFTYNDTGMWKMGTLTVNPFNWMEASYFYYRPKDLIGGTGIGKYLDKGFNVKFSYEPKNINLPTIALGLDDFAGTGLFTREYIVATLPYKNVKVTAGIGWGKFVGDKKISNPLSILSNSMDFRTTSFASQGGTLNSKQWFRGDATTLFGLEYAFQNLGGLKLKIENNPFNFFSFTSTGVYGPDSQELRTKDSDVNFGLSFPLSGKGNIDLSYINGNSLSMSFTFGLSLNKELYKKKDFNPVVKKRYDQFDKKNNFYRDLLSNLASNKIYLQTANIEKNNLSMTVDSAEIDNPVQSASRAAFIAHQSASLNNYNFKSIDVSNLYLGMELNNIKFLTKNLTKDNKSISLIEKDSIISNPFAYNYQSHEFKPKVQFPVIQYSATPDLRSHIGTPSKFYFGGISLKLLAEIQVKRNLVILSNIGYSLYDNFDEKVSYPGSNLPHVRTEIVDYLQVDKYLTQLQIDYYRELYPNLYAKVSAGLYETMFGGIGTEFLYKPFNNNIFIGYEYHDVKRRTYDQRFNFFDYSIKTQHINFLYHHQQSGIIVKTSYGKYLAGDKGFTLDFSRKTRSGFQSGFYFTRTDVPAALFGEGSFDKGFYFKIPNRLFSKSLDKTVTSFSLSPLTRDGGQKLDITNRLIDIITNDQIFTIGNGWNGFLK